MAGEPAERRNQRRVRGSLRAARGEPGNRERLEQGRPLRATSPGELTPLALDRGERGRVVGFLQVDRRERRPGSCEKRPGLPGEQLELVHRVLLLLRVGRRER